MDRQTWLDQRRAAVLASYDQDAATYDDHGYPAQTQQDWVARLVRACPPAAKILDTPCGTGTYFSLVAAAGHRVVGADQSAGMLAQARARNIAIALDQVGLQELPYAGEFDAVMTIDAMEHVPPEDWPLVLANLHRAARPGGLLYLTVEEVADPVTEEAFATLTQRGLPAVRGEVIDGDVGGYHYYPGRDRATAWFDDAGLRVIDEGFSQEDGWGYRHFLLKHTMHPPDPPSGIPTTRRHRRPAPTTQAPRPSPPPYWYPAPDRLRRPRSQGQRQQERSAARYPLQHPVRVADDEHAVTLATVHAERARPATETPWRLYLPHHHLSHQR